LVLISLLKYKETGRLVTKASAGAGFFGDPLHAFVETIKMRGQENENPHELALENN